MSSIIDPTALAVLDRVHIAATEDRWLPAAIVTLICGGLPPDIARVIRDQLHVPHKLLSRPGGSTPRLIITTCRFALRVDIGPEVRVEFETPLVSIQCRDITISFSGKPQHFAERAPSFFVDFVVRAAEVALWVSAKAGDRLVQRAFAKIVSTIRGRSLHGSWPSGVYTQGIRLSTADAGVVIEEMSVALCTHDCTWSNVLDPRNAR